MMPAVFWRAPGACLPLFVAFFLWAVPGNVLGQAETANPPDIVAAPSLDGFQLRSVLAQTLLHHPELAIYSEEVRAREAEMLQAGLPPNPFLSLEAENVLGSGDYSGFNAAELTLAIGQEIELGTKRSRRRALAGEAVDVARSEYLLARANVLAQATKGFIELLAAQQRLELAEELITLAARMLEQVEERIAAGKTAASESGRARIHWREMEIARVKARREVAAARRALAGRMGLEAADFGAAVGDLARLPQPPALADLEGLIEDSPRLARWLEEIELRERTVALERANRFPDLEVELGARHIRESEDTALVFGLSVPLPLFNRNQGVVAAARSRLAGARAQKTNALVQAKATLAEAWQAMAGAHEEAEILRDEILPTARQSLEAAETGYQAGKFGILEVLDSQRTLVEARGRYLEALAAVHRAGTEMGRLLGNDLPGSTLPYLSSLPPRSDSP